MREKERDGVEKVLWRIRIYFLLRQISDEIAIGESYLTPWGIDPSTKQHKLVHSGGFPRFDNCIVAKTVKSWFSKRQLHGTVFQITKFQVNWKAVTVFGCIHDDRPVWLLLRVKMSKTHILITVFAAWYNSVLEFTSQFMQIKFSAALEKPLQVATGYWMSSGYTSRRRVFSVNFD